MIQFFWLIEFLCEFNKLISQTKATLKEDGNGCQGGERGAFEGLGLALRLSVCQLAKKSFPLLLARCCLCHNHHGCEIVIVQIMVEKDDDGGADDGDDV